MALLRKRGLLPPEVSPEEETPAEEKPAEEKPAEEKPVEEQPAPVNPLLNKKPSTDAGNLSWYKPWDWGVDVTGRASETTATALKSMLEKVSVVFVR